MLTRRFFLVIQACAALKNARAHTSPFPNQLSNQQLHYAAPSPLIVAPALEMDLEPYAKLCPYPYDPLTGPAKDKGLGLNLNLVSARSCCFVIGFFLGFPAHGSWSLRCKFIFDSGFSTQLTVLLSVVSSWPSFAWRCFIFDLSLASGSSLAFMLRFFSFIKLLLFDEVYVLKTRWRIALSFYHSLSPLFAI